VVSGDPSKGRGSSPSKLAIADAAGTRSRRTSNPTDETVEVKKGTLLVGMGDKFDASKAKAMKAGDKGQVPAKAHHFAAAQGATFIEVDVLWGPFALTYVNSGRTIPPESRAPKP